MNKILIIFVLLFIACSQPEKQRGNPEIRLQQMQGFPNIDNGFENGVSALFAGVCNNTLIIAGGCNFPETPAAQGGAKRFYKNIFAANLKNDSIFEWKNVGDLPTEIAYGVSISTPDGIICIGGTNSNGALSKVFRLAWNGEKIIIDTLPQLPATIDNSAGAIINNVVYVVGGNVNGKPSNAMFSLDLKDKNAQWKSETPFPENARVQPVCVAQKFGDGEMCLFLFGGFVPAFDGNEPAFSTSSFCYSPSQKTWEKIAETVDENAKAILLAGGVGVAIADSLILCAGGVNKDIFLSALFRESEMKKAVTNGEKQKIDSLQNEAKTYMQQPIEWYKFNKKILLYNTRRNLWTTAGEYAQTARAGAAIAKADSLIFIINGELKPGIRTKEINKLKIQN